MANSLLQTKAQLLTITPPAQQKAQLSSQELTGKSPLPYEFRPSLSPTELPDLRGPPR